MLGPPVGATHLDRPGGVSQEPFGLLSVLEA